MRPLALALLAAIVAAGCMAPGGPPEERAQRAWDDFARSLSGEGGSMAKLEGTMSGGGYGASVLYEFARDGTRHAKVSAGGMSFEYYCHEERAWSVTGDVAYEMRPGSCPLTSGFGEVSFGAILNETRIGYAWKKGDTLFAMVNSTDPEQAAQGGITITVDRKDHVRHVTMMSPGGNLDANVSYERRGNWHAPDTTKRLAANVDGDDDFDYDREGTGTFEWEADNVRGTYALDTFEVRIVDPARNATLATFPLAGAREQAGFAFSFEDEDGDGLLSDRDRFTVTREGWTNPRQYEVLVWDTWADAKVDRRIPAPGIVLAIAVIALAAGVVSRRAR